VGGIRARALAFLIVPFLLVSGLGQAYAQYRCPHDRVVRTACCCPSAHKPHHDTTIAASCCCTVEHVHAVTTETQARDDGQPPTLAPVTSPTSFVVVVPYAPRLVTVAIARPRPPPTLIAQRTSFLI
jgi:hypothetical protein